MGWIRVLCVFYSLKKISNFYESHFVSVHRIYIYILLHIKKHYFIRLFACIVKCHHCTLNEIFNNELLIMLVNSIWVSGRTHNLQNPRWIYHDVTLMAGSRWVYFNHMTFPYLSGKSWIFDCKRCYQKKIEYYLYWAMIRNGWKIHWSNTWFSLKRPAFDSRRV